MNDLEYDRKPGWKLVPNDVTHAQMSAGVAAVNQLLEEYGDRASSADVAMYAYLAMIDAVVDVDQHGLGKIADKLYK
ncbi:hypothetical protein [Vreelandella populi]|uniref:hypothetical protein n=1 Tax=Vreelandella populi TaxID=2498858 RepID=UPI000F8DA4BB|nr:hypothetical protein [Halomonas populi]RUR38575.1 hypothetical protein ELY25_09450 [Halomonas populi]